MVGLKGAKPVSSIDSKSSKVNIMIPFVDVFRFAVVSWKM